MITDPRTGRVNLVKSERYFATKFQDAITDALYSLSRDWASDYSGNSDAPVGWFTEVLSISARDLHEYIIVDDSHLEALNVLVEARVSFESLIGHWIIRGDSQGFIWTAEYDTHASAQHAYQEMESGEVVIKLADGWTLRSGSKEFTSGDYVRLVTPEGEEHLYWHYNEWQEDPQLVMGAIINSAAGLHVRIVGD